MEEAETEFEPFIRVFCCNWCAYVGADLAGIAEQLKNIDPPLSSRGRKINV